MDGTRESNYTLFRFPSHKDAVPEDFLTDPKTGMRPKEMRKPSGVSKTFIDKGFTNSYTVLPPQEIWDKGVWFVMLTPDQQNAIRTTVGNNEWECFIVNGEGSPGNFLARIYVVPDDVAATIEPDHPLLWPEKQRIVASHATGFQAPAYSGYSGNHQYGGYTTSSTPKTQAPALPAGIRFRCDCGHWFKEAGLAPHKTHCCPAKEESREADWAILCECCLTLDQVAACKAGFPRPKKEKEVVQKEETESKETAEATAEAVQ